ncbi:hypothetical protein GWI33_007712 [Rhynchophorus ferrugineus]|uniref:Uncharacterized protein n=1 Tax=Rhynchophorus ferrugineus TaxID=354439 RepID=A0A834IE13_RHYFE|nr:hypothetical protein GWI33_007712 [Rhynchophorus ferrugineus]
MSEIELRHVKVPIHSSPIPPHPGSSNCVIFLMFDVIPDLIFRRYGHLEDCRQDGEERGRRRRRPASLLPQSADAASETSSASFTALLSILMDIYVDRTPFPPIDFPRYKSQFY